MTVWTDVLTAINNFYNWLTGLGGSVAEPLFQLGSWIAQGLSSLGAWLYNAFEWVWKGMQWLGSKFVEGLTWIWQGLNSLAGRIGAALTWVGSGIYGVGQWLWNGILWVGRTVLQALQNLWNWLLEQLTGIWNWIVDLVESFITGLNQWWTDFVKGLREKLKELLMVNMTLPMMWKATERLIENPSIKSLLGYMASPFAGIISAELMDAMLPRPQSTTVTLFPPLRIPRWDYTPISVELPPEPTLPPEYTPASLPSVGYIPEFQKSLGIRSVYDVRVLWPLLRKLSPQIALKYATSVLTPTYATQSLGIKSIGDIVYAGLETASALGKIGLEYTLSEPVTTFQDLAGKIGLSYSITVNPPILIEQPLKIGERNFAAYANVLAEAIPGVGLAYSIDVLAPTYVLQKLLGVSSSQRTVVFATEVSRALNVGEVNSEETVIPPGYVSPGGVGLTYAVEVFSSIFQLQIVEDWES